MKRIRTLFNAFFCINDFAFYMLILFFYTNYLILNYFYIQPEIRLLFHENLLFYFEATISQFQKWFPTYGNFLFFVFLAFKVLIWTLLLSIIYISFRNLRIKFKIQFLEPNFNFGSYLLQQGGIAIFILSYYLLLYALFISKGRNLDQNFQLLISRGFLIHLLVQVLLNIFRYRTSVLSFFKDFFLTPQLPFNISIFRILFFTYLISIYFIQYRFMLPHVSLESMVALPFLGWLIHFIPINVEIYKSFLFLGVFSCLFIIAGYKTRFFLILNAICILYVVSVPNFFGKVWHMHIIIWISCFFTFSRCYDVYSIDAKINKTELIASSDYTFPIRFVWLQLGIIYFWSGFYKLWDAGFDWAFSSSMVNQIHLEWMQNYDKIPNIRIDSHPQLLSIGGLVLILFELSYIIFILKIKWHWISGLGGILMHLFIAYFMYINFFYLLVVFYLFYFNFNLLFKRTNINSEPLKKYSKLAFYFGLCILSINFLFGMLGIKSYPFSSYPSYSALIPDRVKIIEFKCPDMVSTVHEIGKKNNFSWESYGWLEYNLIADFETGKDVQKRLEDYWKIWVNLNPELSNCKFITGNIVIRSVSPDGKYNLDFVAKIGDIAIKN